MTREQDLCEKCGEREYVDVAFIKGRRIARLCQQCIDVKGSDE